MAETLSTLTTVIRDHLDEATAGYWTDAEIQRVIVRRFRSLWSRIIAIRDDWFRSATAATLTLVAGTSRYTFSGMSVTDFFRVATIRTTTSGKESVRWQWMSSKDPRFIEGLRADVTYSDPSVYYYDVDGTSAILVSPLPRAAMTAAIDYYTIPTDPTSTFALVDPLIRWVEATATADCLAKGPVGALQYWRDEARDIWRMEILPVIGAPRSGQNSDRVLSPFEVP